MNISGMSKAKILAALYNASHPLGLGYLHYTDAEMTESEAGELLRGEKYFDYLKGRVMKINLEGDELDTGLYNRDNGPDAAEKAISRAFSDEQEQVNTKAVGMHKKMCVGQGYVPLTCPLAGLLVFLLVSKGENPCAGCNMDRTICHGRPRT